MTYWIRTNTLRLKPPPHLKNVEPFDTSGKTVNWCGQSVAKAGDYVHNVGRGVSAGTVGRVLSLDFSIISHGIAANVEFLDGKTSLEWLWRLTVIDYGAVQEVKDFYIVEEERPSRIKVSW